MTESLFPVASTESNSKAMTIPPAETHTRIDDSGDADGLQERLMRSLYEGQTDVLELARAEAISVAEIAAWSSDSKTLQLLDGLCRLSDLRAQLLISRYRTLAAARLFELAKTEGGGETARKACTDLLNLSLFPMIERANNKSPSPLRGGSTTEDAPAVSIPEIRNFFATLGDPDDAPVPAPDSFATTTGVPS